jgi:hypothetical protein
MLEQFCNGVGSMEADPVLYQTLVRKGCLLVEQITVVGKAYYESLRDKYSDKPPEVEVKKEEEPKPIKVARAKAKEEIADDFTRLWEAFPRTSTFEHGGKFFQGTRTLRKNEEKCRIIFQRVIGGFYDIDAVLRALEYEVWTRMEGSLKKNENQMHYMNMLEVWLNQKCFEAYIGMEIPQPKVDKPDSINPEELF